MVPEGWKAVRLNHIAELVTSGSRDWAQYYSDEGSKFIRMTNLPRDGIYLKLDDLKFVDVKSDSADGKRTSLQSGDILISITAELGKIGWVPDNLGEAYINQHTALVRLKPSKGDSKYVAYLLSSHTMNHRINRLNDSGAKAGLNLPTIRSIPLVLPPLPEQKKIARILSTWDKAITTTEQLLTNSQQQKKALMQQLLTGKKRLLDQNGKRFEGEFKRHHFSDLLAIDTKSLGSQTVPDFEFDYISLSDVNAGRISSTLEKFTFKTAPSRARRIVAAGDILMATVRPNLQGFAQVTEQHQSCIASTGFAVLSPKENVCGDYVYHYLFSAHITGQIDALVVGTNYPAINSSDVAGLCIYCPPYKEQVEIANVFNTCSTQITALQQQLDQLKQEKKALMQQLLTGKRRVVLDA